VREPDSFSPDAVVSDGTVRRPKRTRWCSACSGGGSSIRRYGMPLSANPRSTAAQGCEPWMT
jgi:hypothetical protein